MEYRDFAALLLKAPTAAGLAAVLHPTYDDAELRQSLETAAALFRQPAAACFLAVGPHNTLEAVAAHLDEAGRLATQAKAVTLRGQRLWAVKGKTQQQQQQQQPPPPLNLAAPSLLFRLPAWTLRHLFGRKEYQPYPLLHATSLPRLLGPSVPLALAHRHPRPLIAAAQHLEAVVRLAAMQAPDLDALDAGIVDFLHCVGLVYVVSIDELASPAETDHIEAALDFLRPHGYTHLWWIEDATFFQPLTYHLVVRTSAPLTGEPFFMKRRLRVKTGGTAFVDVDTGFESCSLDFEKGSLLLFSLWVTSLVLVAEASPGGRRQPAKAFPYMRREVLACLGGGKTLPTRPLLVNGVPVRGRRLRPAYPDLALPPRLLHSWDAFLPRTRVPQDAPKPCAVHMRIQVHTWGEDPDIKMFLALEGDQKHVFRLLVDEPDRVDFHVDKPLEPAMGRGDIQMAVLRHKWQPVDGSVVIEFVLVSFWRSFFVFLDSRLADVAMWATVHRYDAAAEPVATGRMDAPIFSSAAEALAAKLGMTLDEALPRAVARFQGQDARQRQAVPIFQAQRKVNKEEYVLRHRNEA